MKTLAELRAEPHTSISRVREFLICPKRHSLKYVDGAAPDFKPIALVLGSAWHAVVETWLASTTAPEDLKEQLRDHLKAEFTSADLPVLFDDPDDDEASFSDHAVKMLTAFLSRVRKPDRVIGVEVPFSLDVVHPKTGEVLSVPLVGALDAIVEEEDRVSLWELKTGAKKWGADQLDYDLQIPAYSLVMRGRGHDRARLRLLITTKATLPVVQMVDVERSPADEEELAELFFSVERAVTAGVDHRLRGWHCRSCPYAGPCR